jgi:hypothetical protein
MPDPTLDDQVRGFFDRFTAASDDLDVDALGELFDETFLLRRDGDRLRVVLYLNHQDLRQVLSSP